MRKSFVAVLLVFTFAFIACEPKETDVPEIVTESLDNSHVVEPDEPAVGKVETERKFLLDIDNLPRDKMAKGEIYELVQSYICFSPEIRLREVNERAYYFNLKRPLDDIGLSRQEIEFRISKEEYDNLFKKQEGAVVYKTRYQFFDSGVYIAVDIYSGVLTGLAVAEVEFGSVVQANAFQAPEWFGEDVTSDKRYKNANLAKDGMP